MSSDTTLKPLSEKGKYWEILPYEILELLPIAITGKILPKEILGAITQRDTESYYPKRDWDVLWENGGNLGTYLCIIVFENLVAKLSKVEGDGEVKVMTRGFGDLVAKLDDKVVMEVLVRCWSDGDVVPTSVPVKWLSFTNRNSDEAQTSEHGVQNLRTFAISAITNSSDIESG
ncbi:hypothetical protein Tco_0681937 [Tanacetum coccineum]|uniref:Uncharacterized protein n=1 Tax=Tanacetum coccineum TaxID=301880 RepID=A0ABQ4XR08_9ASTR